MTSLCGGGEPWCRKVRPCPFCQTRRRHLHRIEMGGYGSRIVCGGCGHEWADLEPEALHSTKDGLAAMRELVRREWPTATGNMREQLKRLLDEEGVTT
jgi:hypothetical protein